MILPTFTAIITAHADSPWPMIEGLYAQTHPPDQILVAASDWWPTKAEPGAEMTVHRGGQCPAFLELWPNNNDFGYSKRNQLLSKAEGEFVGFFCHDDSYEPTYIEEMLEAAAPADAAYCWWDETNQKLLAGTTRIIKPSGMRAFEATLGGFIVRTALIKKAGRFPLQLLPELELAASQLAYGQPVELDAIRGTALGWLDGMALQLLNETGCKAVHVPKLLYHHNKPYDPQMRPSVWGEKE